MKLRLSIVQVSGVEIVTLPYGKVQLKGGGIHRSASPPIRGPVE